MSSRGRFEVTGPGVEGHPVPSVRCGCAVAQSYACDRRHGADEVSFYVREEGDGMRAVVTKEPGVRGAIVTRLVAEWETGELEASA